MSIWYPPNRPFLGIENLGAILNTGIITTDDPGLEGQLEVPDFAAFPDQKGIAAGFSSALSFHRQ